MRWAVPVENFSRLVIEHGLYPLDLRARHLREPCSVGKKLAEQPIGVFVGPTFPRSMRMSKIHLHLRLLREEPVLAHFGGEKKGVRNHCLP